MEFLFFFVKQEPAIVIGSWLDFRRVLCQFGGGCGGRFSKSQR